MGTKMFLPFKRKNNSRVNEKKIAKDMLLDMQPPSISPCLIIIGFVKATFNITL